MQKKEPKTKKSEKKRKKHEKKNVQTVRKREKKDEHQEGEGDDLMVIIQCFQALLHNSAMKILTLHLMVLSFNG
ncbi:MAG: hypothetical protein EBQ89_01360 [Alphaproteobacteria bacterium]|nr:hypothetical protein [Alphaproteobacteria bacterium]